MKNIVVAAIKSLALASVKVYDFDRNQKERLFVKSNVNNSDIIIMTLLTYYKHTYF